MLPENVLIIAGKSRITTEEAIELCEAKITEAAGAIDKNVNNGNEKGVIRNQKTKSHWELALSIVKSSPNCECIIVESLFDPACMALGKFAKTY